MRQLQTGHPDLLAVRHREAVPSERVKLFEKAVHHDLWHLRRAGEWFDIDVVNAVAQIQFTIIRYDNDPIPLGKAESSRIRNALLAIVDGRDRPGA